MFRSNNDDKAKILRGEFGNKSIVCAVEDAVSFHKRCIIILSYFRFPYEKTYLALKCEEYNSLRILNP